MLVEERHGDLEGRFLYLVTPDKISLQIDKQMATNTLYANLRIVQLHQ